MDEQRSQGEVAGDLLERLRALETPQSAGTLAELSYRRAREALEKALDEARNIRVEALEDARATREREMAALAEALRALRHSAETQIASVVAQAETEAAHLSERSRLAAEAILATAAADAEMVRTEAAALRSAVEGRAREVQSLEADFDALVVRLARRIGLTEAPRSGWLKRLFGAKD